ncbi:MAG: bleomycin resistance protein [Thiolinea sp.]
MPKLNQITPMVPVTDLEHALTFFCGTLGFVVGFQAESYAYIRRDNVALRLLHAAPGTDMHDPKRQQACYIDVEGLDALYAAMKPELDKLPPERVRAPFNQDYGQREFHVADEDALLIFFGEAIS